MNNIKQKLTKEILVALDRIKLLADIDPEERLSQEVRDGLALELMCANSRDIGDEEVS